MKDFKAIVSDHLTKQHSEKRYVVVSKDGDVLDTNDGQGFISENKAIVAYSKKHGIKLEKEFKHHMNAGNLFYKANYPVTHLPKTA